MSSTDDINSGVNGYRFASLTGEDNYSCGQSKSSNWFCAQFEPQFLWDGHLFVKRSQLASFPASGFNFLWWPIFCVISTNFLALNMMFLDNYSEIKQLCKCDMYPFRRS